MSTEAEASKLLCPLGIAQNTGATCQGSKCMAWVWRDWQQNSYATEKPEGPGWEKLGNFWTRTPKPGDEWRPGSCGLAER